MIAASFSPSPQREEVVHMELAKLVTMLQSAKEGSEYLDYAIQRLFGTAKPVPLYTRSLDAALKLMPEGWTIHRLGQLTNCQRGFGGWIGEIYRASDGQPRAAQRHVGVPGGRGCPARSSSHTIRSCLAWPPCLTRRRERRGARDRRPRDRLSGLFPDRPLSLAPSPLFGRLE